jgi:hypothetical protein
MGSIKYTIPTDGELGSAIILADDTTGPSDSKNLKRQACGLLLNASTAVRVTLKDMATGTYLNLTGLAVGVEHPLAIKRLWSTGTTTPGNVVVFYGK